MPRITDTLTGSHLGCLPHTAARPAHPRHALSLALAAALALLAACGGGSSGDDANSSATAGSGSGGSSSSGGTGGGTSGGGTSGGGTSGGGSGSGSSGSGSGSSGGGTTTASCGTMTALTTADLLPFEGSYPVQVYAGDSGSVAGSGTLNLAGSTLTMTPSAGLTTASASNVTVAAVCANTDSAGNRIGIVAVLPGDRHVDFFSPAFSGLLLSGDDLSNTGSSYRFMQTTAAISGGGSSGGGSSGSGSSGGGAVVSPSSGSSWTNLATVSGCGNTQYNGVAAGGSTWVAVGNSAWVCRSDDGGATWGTRSQPFTGFSLNDIAWSGARFVAVGTSGRFLSSADGLSWTAPYTKPGEASAITAVVWTGSGFVAVGANDGEGTNVYRSTDGLSWTTGKVSSDAAVPGARKYLAAVAAHGSTLVAVGGATTNCVAWRSTDGGASWASVGSSSCGTGSGGGGFQLGAGLGEGKATGVAYGNGVWVAVGAMGDWARSTDDGLSWTTGAVDSGIPALDRVVFDGAQFIAVGAQKRIYTSTDGQTWTRRNADTTLSAALTKGHLRAVAGSGTGRLVAVGTADTTGGGSGFMTSVP